MTSILNLSSASSSTKDDGLLSKKSTTFIVQPPSSSQTKPTTLLSKRCKPVELGDLLMKKIKTSSVSNSSEQSPVLKANFDDAVYDSSEGLECHSAIEGVRSPSSPQDGEKINDEIILAESLMPQRSLSTPIIPVSLNLNNTKSRVPDSQKQLQNALETLQRRMLLEQQAIILRDIIKRVQFSQDLLKIPALNGDSEVDSPHRANMTREELKKAFIRGEDDPEIIIGEIEYPLLSMAPPSTKPDMISKKPAAGNMSKRNKRAKNSVLSSPDSDSSESLLDSLTVTRAETQRSDTEVPYSLKEVSESFAKVIDGAKRKYTKKAAQETAEKPKKALKKEKAGRQSNNKGLLSPLLKERKMTERRKNKWQDTELNIENKVF